VHLSREVEGEVDEAAEGEGGVAGGEGSEAILNERDEEDEREGQLEIRGKRVRERREREGGKWERDAKTTKKKTKTNIEEVRSSTDGVVR